MFSDQVGDLLTRIRNATLVLHSHCYVNFSNLNVNILHLLKENGYIVDYNKVLIANSKNYRLQVVLKYKGKISVVQGMKRISKPGLRIYSKSSDLPKVLNGIGVAVVSTSNGLMTAAQAKTKRLGGEVLAYIW